MHTHIFTHTRHACVSYSKYQVLAYILLNFPRALRGSHLLGLFVFFLSFFSPQLSKVVFFFSWVFFFEGLALKFIPALWKKAKTAFFGRRMPQYSWAKGQSAGGESAPYSKAFIDHLLCVLGTGEEAVEGATNKIRHEATSSLQEMGGREREGGGETYFIQTHTEIQDTSYSQRWRP